MLPLCYSLFDVLRQGHFSHRKPRVHVTVGLNLRRAQEIPESNTYIAFVSLVVSCSLQMR
jgi:hypothetical protein